MKKQFLLLFAMLLPIMASADDNGSCGDGLTYTYEEATKTLTICKTEEGSGEMQNFDELYYSSTNAPWCGYQSNIVKIAIESGVTSIGSVAFYGCNSLTSISIPEGVKHIGGGAFADCSKLTTIDIPKSVTTIDGSAFYGCNGLESINIPEGVTTINNFIFSGCTNLTSINIPEEVTTIGESAFNGCTNLFSIIIPAEVTAIGKSAFKDCSSLISIKIPKGITTIGRSTFEGCSSITSLYIPEGVTSIGNSAFCDCSSITSLYIPEDVTSIGNNAFSNCSSITSINIPKGVTSIGKYAFNGCSGMKKVIISDIATWCRLSFGNATANPLHHAHHLYDEEDKEIKDLIIPDEVTSIGNWNFEGCSGLTSVNIGNHVTSIGNYAFQNCSGLTTITMGNSVTNFGNAAFNGCGLEKVIISDIAAWCGLSFKNSSLNPLSYAHHLYCNEDTEITNLIIPDEVPSIGNYVFSGCSGLTSVTIGNNTTTIGESAFSDCSSLISVQLPSALSIIRKRAFYSCSGLKDIIIPASVEFIYQEAFSGCNSLISVTAKSETPPFLYENSFSNYNIPLYVSSTAYEAYQAASPWNKFSVTITEGCDLTLTASEGGCISFGITDVSNISKRLSVEKGSNVTLAFTPDEGYILETAAVNDENIMEDIVDGKYTIEDIQADTEVKAIFVRQEGTFVMLTMENAVQTFCANKNLDFSQTEDVKAYTATGYYDGTLTITRVINAPAGTGLLMKGSTGIYEIPVAVTTGYYINLLHGVKEDTTITPTEGNYTNLLLGSRNGVVSFYRIGTAGTLEAGKAYLQLPTNILEAVPANAPLRIVAEDNTTGISEVMSEGTMATQSHVYNLQGQRIGQPQQGLYIMNGKKVVIK